MEAGPKAAIGLTVVVVAAAAIYIGIDQHRRHAEADAPAEKVFSVRSDPDDNVYLKQEHPDSLADERALVGKTVWISAGGQLDYYKDTGKHVDYAHPVAVLLPNEPLAIAEVFEEVAPKSGRAVFRIPAGKRQVLLGFTMPNAGSRSAGDPKAMYAVVVGNYADGGYKLYNDDIFFYDDPHKLFDYWGPAMWAHIDKHEPAVGMSERQLMMSVGQVQTPGKGSYGNRTIVYDNSGHPVTVEFRNNKAVSVTPGG